MVSGASRGDGADRQSILVTDGDERVALALVRAFGGRGHRVVVGASTSRSLGQASRFAETGVVLLDPLSDPDGFVRSVREALDRHGCNVLVPVSEGALYAILTSREIFPDVLLPFGTADRFETISNKIAVSSAAAKVGIAVPRRVVLTSPEEVETAADIGRPPFVIKPARSVVADDGRRIKVGVTYASCRETLRARLEQLPRAAFPVMVQERVVGPGIGVFALRWNGQVHALFAHRRIREKPPSGGVSVYRESVPLDATLREQVVELLDRLEWDGVAMVEFKVEEATGVPYLMEINGRFWGSLQLAIDAGVDFPNLLLDAARGRFPSARPSWTVGVRSRWWWGDFDHLLTRFRRSDAELGLLPGTPSRWAVLGEWFRLRPAGDRNEVLRRDDFKPFLRETVNWFHAFLRRR